MSTITTATLGNLLDKEKPDENYQTKRGLPWDAKRDVLAAFVSARQEADESVVLRGLLLDKAREVAILESEIAHLQAVATIPTKPIVRFEPPRIIAPRETLFDPTMHSSGTIVMFVATPKKEETK